jgi:hypothetical protein
MIARRTVLAGVFAGVFVSPAFAQGRPTTAELLRCRLIVPKPTFTMAEPFVWTVRLEALLPVHIRGSLGQGSFGVRLQTFDEHGAAFAYPPRLMEGHGPPPPPPPRGSPLIKPLQPGETVDFTVSESMADAARHLPGPGRYFVAASYLPPDACVSELTRDRSRPPDRELLCVSDGAVGSERVAIEVRP